MERLQKLLFLMEHKKGKDALKLSGEILLSNPEDSYIYYLHSLNLIQVGENKKALKVLDDGIGINPENPSLYYNKGIIYCDSKKYTKALEMIKIALEFDSNNPDYLGQLSWIYFALGKKEDAKKIINSALSISPEDTELKNIKTIILEDSWDLEEGIKEAKDILRINPNNIDSLVNLGDLYLKKGKNKEALKLHLDALKIDPQNTNAKAGLLNSLKNKVIIYKWIYLLMMEAEKFRDKSTLIFVVLWIFVKPFRIFIAVIFYMYLLLYHIFNFVLLFNNYGKLALTNAQKYTSIIFVIINISLLGVLIYGNIYGNINLLSIFFLFLSSILLVSSFLFLNNKIFFLYYLILGVILLYFGVSEGILLK